jgi:glyoxylase-like metal-dependent hydrolase (beta-lactamase superfamily II)
MLARKEFWSWAFFIVFSILGGSVFGQQAPTREITLPFRDLGDAYIDEWIESLKRVEALDFDILAPGHGAVGRKEHVGMMRSYMQELRSQVLKYVREGKSLDEIKQLVKMEKYSSWGNYKTYLPLNIEGMHRHVQLHRRPN